MKKLLLLLLFGCAPKVGDSCEDAEDCKRIPQSYCAVTGICLSFCVDEGGSCRGEGVCVETPMRTICLPSCDEDDDCRHGESCLEVKGGRVCQITDPLAPPT